MLELVLAWKSFECCSWIKSQAESVPRNFGVDSSVGRRCIRVFGWNQAVPQVELPEQQCGGCCRRPTYRRYQNTRTRTSGLRFQNWLAASAGENILSAFRNARGRPTEKQRRERHEKHFMQQKNAASRRIASLHLFPSRLMHYVTIISQQTTCTHANFFCLRKLAGNLFIPSEVERVEERCANGKWSTFRTRRNGDYFAIMAFLTSLFWWREDQKLLA